MRKMGMLLFAEAGEGSRPVLHPGTASSRRNKAICMSAWLTADMLLHTMLAATRPYACKKLRIGLHVFPLTSP